MICLECTPKYVLSLGPVKWCDKGICDRDCYRQMWHGNTNNKIDFKDHLLV